MGCTANHQQNCSLSWKLYDTKFNSLPPGENHTYCKITIFIMPYIISYKEWGSDSMYSHRGPIIYGPQFTLRKKYIKKRNTKKWGHPFISWLVIGNSNSTPVYKYSKYLTNSLDWYPILIIYSRYCESQLYDWEWSRSLISMFLMPYWSLGGSDNVDKPALLAPRQLYDCLIYSIHFVHLPGSGTMWPSSESRSKIQ